MALLGLWFSRFVRKWWFPSQVAQIGVRVLVKVGLREEKFQMEYVSEEMQSVSEKW